MSKKIPNFKKRLEDALYDPLQRLAKELYVEGMTEEELSINMKQLKVSDVVKLKLSNYLRDEIRK